MKLTNLPDWYRSTRQGQAAIREAQEHDEALRATAIAEIEESKAELRTKMPALDAAIAKAAEGERKTLGAYRQAQERSNAALLAKRLAQAAAADVLRRHASMLRQTAPDVIATFGDWLQSEVSRLRREGLSYRFGGMIKKPNTMGGPQRRDLISNTTGFGAVHIALMAAIRAAQEWPMKLATQAEAEAEIAKLRAEIPFHRLSAFEDDTSFHDEASAA